MIKLAVFDWNGTILSDVDMMLKGVDASAKILNLPPIDIRTYRNIHDIPISKLYKNLGVERDVFNKHSAAVADAWHNTYEPLAVHARTRTGSRACLKELRSSGVKNIILSNHTVEAISLQLSRLKLSSLFDAILANDDIYANHSAGKQDRLSDYLKLHDYKSNDIVIIGDTVEEIRIGKQLGLKTIAISGGYQSLARLKKPVQT